MNRTAGLSPAATARRVLEAVAAGRRVVTAVVTASGDREMVGRRCLIADGKLEGSTGQSLLDEALVSASPTLFPAGVSSGARDEEFHYEVGGEERSANVYMELHAPPARMVIVGAGHIARPLCDVGRLLGLEVEILDDRPEFATAARFPSAREVTVIDFRDPFASTPLDPTTHVILVTRGHRYDYECLIRLLRMDRPPHYIGMIGSRRRVRATHEQLARDGFSPEQMRRVRAPVGLDLGGQTPAEIAISVAAEIIMIHAGGSGTPLTEKERVVERFFEDRPKAVNPDEHEA